MSTSIVDTTTDPMPHLAPEIGRKHPRHKFQFVAGRRPEGSEFPDEGETAEEK